MNLDPCQRHFLIAESIVNFSCIVSHFLPFIKITVTSIGTVGAETSQVNGSNSLLPVCHIW